MWKIHSKFLLTAVCAEAQMVRDWLDVTGAEEMETRKDKPKKKKKKNPLIDLKIAAALSGPRKGVK